MRIAKRMAKLLLIDDSTDFRTVFERKFTELGHQVVTAGDGVRGLQVVMTAPLDLVLLDLNMPHRGGLETLRLIRSTQPKTRVMIISALVDDAARAEARTLGVVDIILKPVGMKELITAVDTVLARPA